MVWKLSPWRDRPEPKSAYVWDPRKRFWLVEYRSCMNPGNVTSPLAMAPPTVALRSSTATDHPARARYMAATRPLWPPPITTASYEPAAVISWVPCRWASC